MPKTSLVLDKKNDNKKKKEKFNSISLRIIGKKYKGVEITEEKLEMIHINKFLYISTQVRHIDYLYGHEVHRNTFIANVKESGFYRITVSLSEDKEIIKIDIDLTEPQNIQKEDAYQLIVYGKDDIDIYIIPKKDIDENLESFLITGGKTDFKEILEYDKGEEDTKKELLKRRRENKYFLQ